MQKRQKDEILRDILDICNGGSQMSKIMFQGYLSHSQVKGYLNHLIANGFIQKDDIDKMYITTSKGLQYLEVVSKMRDMLPVATKRAASKEQLVSPFGF
jgi:predicted transcriptional regulator